MIHCVLTVAREERVKALWQGIVPGIQRQLIYGSLRIGLYPVVSKAIAGQGKEQNIFTRILSGVLTGAFAITVASPTDLVKIRLQAEGKKAPGEPRKYNGSVDAYQKIYKESGIKGFWKGIYANIARNATINAVELAGYDQVKIGVLTLLPFASGDSALVHASCGFGAGFLALLAGSPIDVLKTRLMNVIK